MGPDEPFDVLDWLNRHGGEGANLSPDTVHDVLCFPDVESF